ncbi:MAG: hypothetical protein EA408_09205 [Marinilabiliales bacterium]|nr:MAG: hypothetical protein EA408_09205 [Marinilabiliales bacterium]
MFMQIDNLAFWGIFLVLCGGVLLARVIFNLRFPVLRTIFGLLVILTGIRLLSGNPMPWPVKTAGNEIFFKTETIQAGDTLPGDLHIVFSKAVVILDNLSGLNTKKELRINNLFSASTIYLPEGIPVSVTVDAIFAGVKMPGVNTPVFGRGRFLSDDFESDKPHLLISANSIFGSVTFSYGD